MAKVPAPAPTRNFMVMALGAPPNWGEKLAAIDGVTIEMGCDPGSWGGWIRATESAVATIGAEFGGTLDMHEIPEPITVPVPTTKRRRHGRDEIE